MSTLQPDKRELMRRAFPPKLVGKLPATSKRPALDYVGHAAVTDRLQSVDEDWTFTIDREFEHGAEFWIRGTLTVGGVSRPEYGSGPNPLEAVSHFLRRAAMRFGVALDLWSKEELIEASSSPAQVTRSESSGRDGGERGAGEAADGEAVSEPAPPRTEADRWQEEQPKTPPPSDKQRMMEQYHPGKAHKMKQGDAVPQQWFCTGYDGVRCDWSEWHKLTARPIEEVKAP